MKTIVIVSIVLAVVINLIFVVMTCAKADGMNKSRKTFVLGALKDMIIQWYKNRNILGVILSSILVILMIPGILFIVAFELFLWIIGIVLCLMTCIISLIVTVYDSITRKSK